MADTDPWLPELEEERRQKNDFMARHPESPFVSARVPFHDLRYFPPDPAFRVPARLVRLVTPQEAYLRTNRDGSSVMRYIGELAFRLGSKELRLRVYHAGEGIGAHVFVPFRDATSGRESYGPGRYVTLELNEADSYDLDFNRAFNPYCAYTDDYECGFPPAENDLPVPVRAGERAWSADRNPRTPSTLVKERTAKALGRPVPSTRAGRSRKPRAAAGAPRGSKAAPGRGSPRPKRARTRAATGGGRVRGSPSRRTGPPRRPARGPRRGSSPSRRRGR